MPEFIPGLRLSGLFYDEAVRPILERRFPDLCYSAALIGPGSEVMGFDTPLSRDHSWGPRLQLFLGSGDLDRLRAPLVDVLAQELPRRFRGYSTHFGSTGEGGITWMEEPEAEPFRHGVQVHSLHGWVQDYLAWDMRSGPHITEWLTFSEQKLRSIVDGRVFYDGLGQLEPLRERLGYYPRDVWLYLMAAQWGQIGQEEAFLGRAGDVGDELGSRLVAARLVRYVMKLGFLLERTYAPYSKWFGTAFARLTCGPLLLPVLDEVLAAPTWREREAAMSRAYGIVTQMHNSLGFIAPLDGSVSSYFDRPYQVIHADRFFDSIKAAIESPQIEGMEPFIGSVNQFVESTDILESPRLCRHMMALFE